MQQARFIGTLSRCSSACSTSCSGMADSLSLLPLAVSVSCTVSIDFSYVCSKLLMVAAQACRSF